MNESTLKITEIFYSLQGEARTIGLPTVFVRLTGCPLRCGYCDSEYAFYGGERLSFDAIFDKINEFGAKYICVTGGEPLAQKECIPFLRELAERGYEVSLETSGALAIDQVDARISRVMDIKTPGSGEVSRNLWSNLEHLTQNDQIKFVICSREDYEWARFKVDEHQLQSRVSDVFFSPCHGLVQPVELAEWILADKLPVRFQLQMHKLLWNDAAGH